MTEKLITIKDTDINKILGSNNAKFNKIKTYFPQVKLISRGDQVKIIGSKKEISLFELKFNMFISHINKFNSLTYNQIERIIEGDQDVIDYDSDAILHGKNGKVIKARTYNQRKMVSEKSTKFSIFGIFDMTWLLWNGGTH